MSNKCMRKKKCMFISTELNIEFLPYAVYGFWITRLNEFYDSKKKNLNLVNIFNIFSPVYIDRYTTVVSVPSYITIKWCYIFYMYNKDNSYSIDKLKVNKISQHVSLKIYRHYPESTVSNLISFLMGIYITIFRV